MQSGIPCQFLVLNAFEFVQIAWYSNQLVLDPLLDAGLTKAKR